MSVMFTVGRSRRGGARAMVVAALVLGGASATWAQQTAPAAQPAQQPAQPAQAAPQAAPGLVFGSDAGVIFNVIKADKTADFEAVMSRLKEALAKSENPVRKQQAAGWKIYKAQEPAPNGNVWYLFVMDPVVKDADYTVSKILAEAFPTEAQDLYAKYRDAYVPGGFRLSLMNVTNLGQ